MNQCNACMLQNFKKAMVLTPSIFQIQAKLSMCKLSLYKNVSGKWSVKRSIWYMRFSIIIQPRFVYFYELPEVYHLCIFYHTHSTDSWDFHRTRRLIVYIVQPFHSDSNNAICMYNIFLYVFNNSTFSSISMNVLPIWFRRARKKSLHITSLLLEIY